MAVTEVRYIHQRDYQAVALSHFLVDLLNSSRTLIMAILAIALGLSNVQVALVLLLFNVGNALTQPFFGRLADRIGPRWLVIGGNTWMLFFNSLAAVAPPWLALIALTVSGLGSGAFHPTGTMVASQASVKHRTQATSIFFMAGQLGLFLGPVIAGLLLEQYGRVGYIFLPIVMISGVYAAWKWLPGNEFKDSVKTVETKNPAKINLRKHLLNQHAIFLALIIFCTSTISLSTINFSPILFTELSYSQSYVGFITGIFMLGSAIGGVAGGMMADRTNGRLVIFISAAASIIPIYLYVVAGDSYRAILLLLAGFFIGMPHSVLVIMVQNLWPGQRAMGSGLALGFMFFSGTIGILVVGFIADHFGLAITLQMVAFLSIITIISTKFISTETEVETNIK